MDVVCLDDLDEFGAELDDPLGELAQDVHHILLEPRGSNLDDPARWLGIEDALSGPFDPGLPQRIEAELRKDSRIDAVRAQVTELAEGSFRIQIEIEANGEELGLTFEGDRQGRLRRVP